MCTVSVTTVTVAGTGHLFDYRESGRRLRLMRQRRQVTQTFTVNPASQVITFDAIPDYQIYGGSPFQLAAQSSSLLPVTFSTTSSACKVTSGQVVLLSMGTCLVKADQAGNANYSAAAEAAQSFVVSQATQSGLLSPAQNSPVTLGTTPKYVAVGDFDGNGHPDTATVNFGDNTVSVMLGDGSGGFTSATGSPFAVGASPDFVAVGDFNGDGKQDLAVVNEGDNTITILLGNGSGGFTPASGGPVAVGNNPYGVAVGDFNGDSIQDLAVPNFNDNTVTVLLGNGAGGFTPSGNPIAVGASPTSVTVGDFNSDGILDLAVSNQNDSTVTILQGNGAGGFTAPEGTLITVGSQPVSVVALDFNGDGILDLAVANQGDHTVTVLSGIGNGLFTPITPVPTVGLGALSLVAGDFNGDGFPDLATSNLTSNTITLLLGDGSGAFHSSAATTFAVGTQPSSLAVGDFNGDSLLDLAVTNQGDDTESILLGGIAGMNSVISTTSPLTINFGDSITLTDTVSAATTSYLGPVGSVLFLDNGSAYSAASQSASPYSFTTNSLSVGIHPFSAQYGGGSGNAISTSNTLTIQVNAALQNQTITFGTLSNVNFGVAPFTISATSDSGLTVSFTSNSTNVCTVNVATVTIAGLGTCSITASQAGNSNYFPATPVTQNFDVNIGSQTISFDTIPTQILALRPSRWQHRPIPVFRSPSRPRPLHLQGFERSR